MLFWELNSSVDVIVLLGYAWMTTSNVIQPAKKRLTLIPLRAARRAGTARGFLTKSLGKSHLQIYHRIYFTFRSKNLTCRLNLCCRHCRSEVNQPNKFEIYRTAQECCTEQFSGSSTCLQVSNDSHAPFPWPLHNRPNAPPDAKNIWGTEASHTTQWFPDLINKQNCVRGNNYENWMQTDGFVGLYLFGNNATKCCQKW